MNKINLKRKLSLFTDYWQPHIAGELNGQYVKLVKFKGPFTWHHHENEDELFMVLQGRFRMEYREAADDATSSDRPETAGQLENELGMPAGNGPGAEEHSIWLEEGEVIIVPRGVEHRPVADEECHVLLFEPASTLNTGNIQDEFTVRNLQHI